MPWIAVVVLVTVWMIGLVTSVTLSGLLHLLLLGALAIALVNLLADRRSA
jgi:Family of unknown function (DUF5670)